jgi:hypothetical protein
MNSKPEGTMTIDKLVSFADAIVAEVEKAVVGKTAVLGGVSSNETFHDTSHVGQTPHGASGVLPAIIGYR